jgi:hypothetical protein
MYALMGRNYFCLSSSLCLVPDVSSLTMTPQRGALAHHSIAVFIIKLS